MGITTQEFDKLSALCKLSFSDEEKEKTKRAFDEIIAIADRINILATKEQDEPLFFFEEAADAERLREDEAVASYPREDILSDAESENGFFKVRQVRLK